MLPPPSLTSLQRLFAWSVFSLQLQPACRTSLRGESEGRGAVEIGGGGGGLLCFKISSKKKNRIESKDNVSISKSRRLQKILLQQQQHQQESSYTPVSENGAARRGRARLCGGEHREEAHQKGLSQEHRRTFLCTFKGGSLLVPFPVTWFGLCYFVRAQVTVQCIVKRAV